MPNGRQKMMDNNASNSRPDFPGESRHEFVAKLAYQHWVRRGMPLGSPEVDWFAAERDLYESLVASGLVSPSASNKPDMDQRIYR
jgi:Protein of unknown function (DUF2934)